MGQWVFCTPLASYENLLRGKKTMERGQDGGRELPVKVYLPPLHVMHYNNLISYINEEMTLEQ